MLWDLKVILKCHILMVQNWLTHKMEMANAFGLSNEETINVDRMSPHCLLENESHSAGSYQNHLFQKIGTILLNKSESFMFYIGYELLEWNGASPSLKSILKNEKIYKGWGWLASNNCFFRIFLSMSLHTVSLCQFEIKTYAWWTILACVYVCIVCIKWIIYHHTIKATCQLHCKLYVAQFNDIMSIHYLPVGI